MSSAHEKVLQLIQIKESRPLAIDPAKTALLVIDVNGDFVDPKYEFGQALEAVMPGVTADYFTTVRDRVLPNIKLLQQAFRDSGRPIFYTGTGSPNGTGSDLPPWLRDFDELGKMVLSRRVWPKPGEAAWQIVDEIRPAAGEQVLNKTAADPLMCTDLLASLRKLGIETVVVAGLSTDVCAGSTARSCADHGFQTILVSDACATLSKQLHEATLQIFSLAFGRVRKTAELVDLIREQRSAAAQ